MCGVAYAVHRLVEEKVAVHLKRVLTRLVTLAHGPPRRTRGRTLSPPLVDNADLTERSGAR
jgi:hypothetical protein